MTKSMIFLNHVRLKTLKTEISKIFYNVIYRIITKYIVDKNLNLYQKCGQI